MCKAGKGQKHNPQVNHLGKLFHSFAFRFNIKFCNAGKYVVRLFWMGCWRKIVIDDLLPVDLTNHVLLPSLDKPDEEASKTTIQPDPKKDGKTPTPLQPAQKVIELWPFLLSKALIKLASLTRTECREMLDFSIIQCLTGWFLLKVDVKGILTRKYIILF